MLDAFIGREQRARAEHQRRRAGRAVVRLAQGQTKLRLREGESTLLAGLLRDEQRKILTGFPGIIARADPAIALRPDQRRDQPVRHRHAADAAHRADARADGRGSVADLHRHAAQRRPRRAATAHRAAARVANPTPAAPGAPSPPVARCRAPPGHRPGDVAVPGSAGAAGGTPSTVPSPSAGRRRRPARHRQRRRR